MSTRQPHQSKEPANLRALSFYDADVACYWLAAVGSAVSAADAAPFLTFFFFGFFTCFSVGAEYDDTALDSCGAEAGCANDGCARAATPKAVNINISFFIRLFSVEVASIWFFKDLLMSEPTRRRAMPAAAAFGLG
ncbi:hypothetical protein [Paraburkholderia bannensis]|uniref:hypothetical protein n=1 Tax=Paraburkholderia bannensis TaxID=765414 RepID=UPI0038CD53E2